VPTSLKPLAKVEGFIVACYSVEVAVDVGVVVVVEVVSSKGGPASGWEVTAGEISGVEVETVGVVVAEVITGMVSSVEMVVVEVITGMVSGVEVVNDMVVVAVGIMIGGVSEMIVDPRCLLSHAATAVTPSCHDS